MKSKSDNRLKRRSLLKMGAVGLSLFALPGASLAAGKKNRPRGHVVVNGWVLPAAYFSKSNGNDS